MIAHKKHFTTPLTPLYSTLFEEFDVQVWIKRDDLNHPIIQGNKWHKLKKNLQLAQKQGKTMLITFGGAYSNHIAATAFAAKTYGFNAIGIIRGEELASDSSKWSKTLKTAHQNGMHFQFISRQNYRKKDSEEYLNKLQKQYPQAYILPEGGSNELAILGFEELVDDLHTQCPEWTHLFCPVGTGGTFTGLIHFSEIQSTLTQNNSKNLIGIPVLKQGDYVIPDIKRWLNNLQDNSKKYPIKNATITWQLLTEYHDGGYAKQSQKGLKFQQDFEKEFAILLDPIYTSKMVFAFYDQLKKGIIPKGSNVILLHTGGLQGRNKKLQSI